MRRTLLPLLVTPLFLFPGCESRLVDQSYFQMRLEDAGGRGCLVEGPEGSGRVLFLKFFRFLDDSGVNLSIYDADDVQDGGGFINYPVPGRIVAMAKCVSGTTTVGLGKIAAARNDGTVYLIDIESGVDTDLGPSGVESITGIEFVEGSQPGRKNIVAYGEKGNASDAVGIYIDNGDGTYSPGSFDSGLSSVTGLQGADLDDDGDEDLVYTSPTGPAGLRTALSDGAMSYAAALGFPVAEPASALASVDLDKDGRKDVVVLSSPGGGSPGKATAFKNLGDGTLSQTDVEEVGSGPTLITFGDVNRDNETDAVVIDGSNDQAIVLFGIPGVGFDGSSSHIVPDGVDTILLTDVGGPGTQPYPFVDLVIHSSFESVVTVILGDGSDLVSEQYQPNSTAIEVLDFALADFNNSGDGVLEAAVLTVPSSTGSFPYDLSMLPWNASAQSWGNFGPTDNSANLMGLLTTGDIDGANGPDLAGGLLSGGVGILLNDGAGGLSLQPLTIDTGFSQVDELVLVDINPQESTDAHLDAIILVNNELRAWFGQGDGTFVAGPTTPATGRSMAAAVEADGTIRVCVAHPALDFVTLWQVNADGTFTQTDTVSIAPAEDISSIAAGDWNSDGLPDFLAVSSDDPQQDVHVFVFERQAAPGDYEPTTLFTGARADGWHVLDATLTDTNDGSQPEVLALNNGFASPEQFLALLPGITVGSETIPVEIYLSGEPQGRVEVSPLGGDGRPWFISGKQLNGAGLSAMPVRLRTPPCPGDIADDFGTLTPDAMVSFGDFLALLGLVGPCPGMTPGCTGDIADDFGSLGPDAQVSFGDFLALLGLVGPCP